MDDVSQRLVRDAFPFLDALATREGITARWPRFAAELDTSMGSAWEAVRAILHAVRGEKQHAAELLRALNGDGPWSRGIQGLASDLDVPLD